jgi:hypothetical protein
MIPFFAHKSPMPEPEDEPLPPREPVPDEEPVPHPDPVIAPLPDISSLPGRILYRPSTQHLQRHYMD